MHKAEKILQAKPRDRFYRNLSTGEGRYCFYSQNYHTIQANLSRIQYYFCSIQSIDNKVSSMKIKEAVYESSLKIVANRTSRIGTSVSAYLILKQQDKILFHLRKNTGYCDGMWSLVAGHVEEGESATEGMIREAREEIGIELYPDQIQVVHVMHRKTNRLNVDVFFDCKSWQGEIQNCEPEKCERLEFFNLSSLPSNTVDYNKLVLNSVLEGKFYSEWGWEK